MTTHRAIVHALLTSAANNEPVVLATVVRITGSSYGGVGTRMVARIDGTTVGIVSGGCLESDLAEHARDVERRGQPRVVTYDTRADDETSWGLGLGCNGLIDVLLEPLAPAQAGAVGRLLEQALSARAPGVMVTVISSADRQSGARAGAHALFSDETVVTTGEWGDRSILDEARRHLASALSSGRRGLVAELEGCELAFEIIRPAVQLVICGTGPDVAPLARMGVEAGWSVTVVDHRPLIEEHVKRFFGATVIECSDPDDLPSAVSITSSTAAVVMSHHYPRDLGYVRALLATDAGYIGVLGPRARSERMLGEMSEEETASAGERMFAPIGLDIGGDGPESIALSIMAEVSAVLSGRSGSHLRNKGAPLH
jgi:xanthine dehydrogenase accessory factor